MNLQVGSVMWDTFPIRNSSSHYRTPTFYYIGTQSACGVEITRSLHLRFRFWGFIGFGGIWHSLDIQAAALRIGVVTSGLRMDLQSFRLSRGSSGPKNSLVILSATRCRSLAKLKITTGHQSPLTLNPYTLNP